MVVAHSGTLAQPEPPAPVNITAVEIVLWTMRGKASWDATGLRVESLSVCTKKQDFLAVSCDKTICILPLVALIIELHNADYSATG